MSQQHTPNSQGAVHFNQRWQTNGCPLSHGKETLYLQCKTCIHHIQSMGFTVICRKEIEVNEVSKIA